MSNRDEWKRLRRDLQAAGFDLVVGKSGHYKVYLDGKLRYSLPATSSDYRCLLNVKKQLRRQLGVAL